MKIYGLSGDPRGQKQSGKDSFATLCAVELHKAGTGVQVRSRALADPLKEFCMKYIGLSKKACYGEDADKDEVFSYWGDVFDIKLQTKYGAKYDDAISGRTIMQVVGTDIFRDCFRDTFWTDMMENITIPEAIEDEVDILFITDMRFINEVNMVSRLGGETFRIYRDIPRADAIVHRSERELAEVKDEGFDHIIHNEGDFESYRETAKAFLRQEGLL